MNDDHRRKLLARYRVIDGGGFRLADHDPDDTAGISRDAGEKLLAEGVARLAELQDRLYAAASWAMLVVLQAMDAAGKDGTIKHVMTGVNPQGVSIVSFKAPTPAEKAHDFLWRHAAALPRRGFIALHNRSHYEEVLVVRVHPDMLDGQHLPPPAREQKHFWRHRLSDIAQWEDYLARQGTVQLKIFLNVSREEQRKRLLTRLDDPNKTWKFEAGDLVERARWHDYMAAFESAISATAAPHAPWYIVPADHKWFSHLVTVEAMVAALEALDLTWPMPTTPKPLIDEARLKLSEDG